MENDGHKSPAPHNAALSITKVIVYLVYLVAVFIETILLLRVFFLLFSANPSTPFVNFVYTTSTQFMAPFQGIFPSHAVTTGVNTTGYLDTSALFAAMAYLILVTVIQSVLAYLDRR